MSDTITITIPPEALEAGRKAFANAGTADDDRDPFAEACLAMLRSWPGMVIHGDTYTIPPRHRIILPLNTEPSDDK